MKPYNLFSCKTTNKRSSEIGECSKADHKVILKTIVCLRWGVEECGGIVFQSLVQNLCPQMHWILSVRRSMGNRLFFSVWFWGS